MADVRKTISSASTPVVAPSSARSLVKSAGASGMHSYSPEEAHAFTTHINTYLGADPYLSSNGYVPVDPNNLFLKLADGVLLCRLVNLATPGTIDERAINRPSGGGKALSVYAAKENLNLAINSAKGIGCQVVNIHASDLLKAHEFPHLALGLLWQLIRLQLLARVTLRSHPEVVRLVTSEESLADLLALPPEELLLRWFNFHLARDGAPIRVTNFGPDLTSGVAYLHLFHSISPDTCPRAESLDNATPTERAARAIACARSLGVPVAVSSSDITGGNRRLNLAFTAEVFNHAPGLSVEEGDVAEAMQAAGLSGEAEADAREERVFRLWMNSLNLGDGDIVLHSLTSDCRDGVALLETIDKVVPGTVDWRRVNRDRARMSRFKAIENCNYVVALGKAPLGLSLTGIGGIDLADGNRKLLLAVVWQVSLRHVLQVWIAIRYRASLSCFAAHWPAFLFVPM